MRFRDAVEAFDDLLTEVEAQLDDGLEPALPDFDDGTELTGPVTAGDRARFEQVMARLAATSSRIQLAKIDLLQEASSLDRKRHAAHAYAANGAHTATAAGAATAASPAGGR